MPFYYYFIILIVLSVIALYIRSFTARKKNLPIQLFIEALKHENSGHFEEAVINYENALNEAKKARFHNNLEIKIIEKIKVLHTIIEYKNSLHFTR